MLLHLLSRVSRCYKGLGASLTALYFLIASYFSCGMEAGLTVVVDIDDSAEEGLDRLTFLFKLAHGLSSSSFGGRCAALKPGPTMRLVEDGNVEASPTWSCARSQ